MRMDGWLAYRKPKLHARADSSISPRPRPSLACACVTSVSPRAAQMDPHQIFHGIVALYGPVCRVSPPPTHHIASLAASVPALRVAQHRPEARSRWAPVYSTVRIEQGRIEGRRAVAMPRAELMEHVRRGHRGYVTSVSAQCPRSAPVAQLQDGTRAVALPPPPHGSSARVRDTRTPPLPLVYS